MMQVKEEDTNEDFIAAPPCRSSTRKRRKGAQGGSERVIKAEAVDAAPEDNPDRASVKSKSGETSEESQPYPHFLNPLPQQCQDALESLVLLHRHTAHDDARKHHHMNHHVQPKVEGAASPPSPPPGPPPASSSLSSSSPPLLAEPSAAAAPWRQSVLDALVRTMLSQNTTDKTSLRAYVALKQAFPTWEAVAAAPSADVEAAIRVGGLAEVKTARIKAILETIRLEAAAAAARRDEEQIVASEETAAAAGKAAGEGTSESLAVGVQSPPPPVVSSSSVPPPPPSHPLSSSLSLSPSPSSSSSSTSSTSSSCSAAAAAPRLSLEYLRSLPTAAVKAQLGRFPGVGPKTVSCVLLFALGRPDFPVDTHVWRIAKRLRWVPPNASREQAYGHLNARIPDSMKYDLHVLLVEHGKRCTSCLPAKGRLQKDSHGPCPLRPAALTTSPSSAVSSKEKKSHSKLNLETPKTSEKKGARTLRKKNQRDQHEPNDSPRPKRGRR